MQNTTGSMEMQVKQENFSTSDSITRATESNSFEDGAATGNLIQNQ